MNSDGSLPRRREAAARAVEPAVGHHAARPRVGIDARSPRTGSTSGPPTRTSFRPTPRSAAITRPSTSVEPSTSAYSAPHDLPVRRAGGRRRGEPRRSRAAGRGGAARSVAYTGPRLRLKNSFSQSASSVAPPVRRNATEPSRPTARSSQSGSVARMPAKSLPSEAWWIPWRPFSTTNAARDEEHRDERRQEERVSRRERRAVSAFEEAAVSGRTSIQFGGRLVDLNTVRRARELLAHVANEIVSSSCRPKPGR